jgi:ion channel
MWTLVAVIFASSITDSHPAVGALLAFVMLAGVVWGVHLSGSTKMMARLVIPTSTLWAVARLLEECGRERHPYDYLSHACGLILSCTLLWALLSRMREANQVTSEVIAEAVIVYLILAIAFSQMYWFLNEGLVNAFNQKIAACDNSTLLYFSLVTMTTAAYGEILPIQPFVRFVAAFESVGALFYIVIVVARLVAGYRWRTTRPYSVRLTRFRESRDTRRAIRPLNALPSGEHGWRSRCLNHVDSIPED